MVVPACFGLAGKIHKIGLIDFSHDFRLSGTAKFVAIFSLTLALTSAEPGCRFFATRLEVPEIVSGCGMALRDGGSAKRRQEANSGQ